ncbi:ER membrane protein complex subunit 4 [Diplonema papillatum]|nr:ER membrane protein complex subunit 4 [Diplonema papillatum]
MSSPSPSTAVRALSPHEQMQVKKKKLWEVATSPRKQMMMVMFMMWMSGNDISIFPIMITGQAIYSPLSAILGVDKLFEKVVDGVRDSKELQDEMQNAKITFILHQFAFLAMGLVKCYYLGLIPTNALDWIDHRPSVPVQYSAGFAA